MTTKKDPSAMTPRSLDDSEIEDVVQPSRRSAISAVGTAVAGAIIGAVALAPREAAACVRRTGVTNSDPGDGVGRGRTGITNSDPGDAPGCGRGVRRRCTDSDPNDRPGRGVRC